MRSYSDSLSRCIWMALLVVLMLFPAVAIDPLGLNSPVGLTTPVSADDGEGWSGTWANTVGGVQGQNMELTQSGNNVTGYNSAANRFVKCLIDPNNPKICRGTWDKTNSLLAEMTLSPDGQTITVRTQFSHMNYFFPTETYTRRGSGTGTGTTTGTGSGTGTGTTTATTTGAGWSGTWQTTSSSWGALTITQSGNQVTGDYIHSKGKIAGTVSGNQFTGTWFEEPSFKPPWDGGALELTLAPDGQSMTGRWRDEIGVKWVAVTFTRTGSGTGTGTTTGTGTGAMLTAESRTAAPDSTVQVPIRLDKASNIGSMNFVLTYNAQVLKVNKVDSGSLLSGALFTPNFKTPPQVRFGLATSGGISGSGSVAYIEFQVIGAAGSSSPLTLSEVDTTDTSGKSVALTTQNGTVTVASGSGAGGKMKGDYNGDGKVTELDALAALKMSVKLLPEDLTLDMDGNGKVTAEDARLILKKALGK